MTPTAAAQYYALLREMANFTAAVYVHPADGRRFGIQTPAYDEDVECARLMANDACIHVISGTAQPDFRIESALSVLSELMKIFLQCELV